LPLLHALAELLEEKGVLKYKKWERRLKRR